MPAGFFACFFLPFFPFLLLGEEAGEEAGVPAAERSLLLVLPLLVLPFAPLPPLPPLPPPLLPLQP